MSIPLIGSPELFEAPKDSEWDGALGDEQSIKSLIGHDLDVIAFTADHGGGFDLDWSQGGHWGVFHSSWARRRDVAGVRGPGIKACPRTPIFGSGIRRLDS